MPQNTRPSLHRLVRWAVRPVIGLSSLVAAALAVMAGPGVASESVFLEFGPLSRSISTVSLEAFAATGEADADLAVFLRRLSPEQQQGLREALTASRAANTLQVSQWFYTPMGEQALLFAGTLVQTDARQNGQQALRSAFIAAAAEDGEISLLDIIRLFPTASMRVNLTRAVTAAQQAIAEADRTVTVLNAIAQQSEADAALPPPVDLAALPDLTQLGPFRTRKVSLSLEDSDRDRTYPVDVYLPQNLRLIRGTLPVVVISHGLGDSRTSFLDIGAHIASYGFVVALPEHIGSNHDQKAAMFAGLSNETFRAREFIDRPLDITYLLDQLARTNQSDYAGKLNLDRVAVMGHSFGGYTALALAGATIDFDRLARECTPETNIVINAAQLLECRSLELTSDPAVVEALGQTGVRDPRVKMVLAYAPVSQLFGQSGIGRIQIPTVIMGGAFDVVAPAVPQQVDAFRWLTTTDKYLYLGENSSHTADLTRMTNDIFNIDRDLDQSIEDALELNRSINKALGVAFAKVYLSTDPAYEPFLRSAYVEAVSQVPFKRHLVRELPASLLPILEEN